MWHWKDELTFLLFQEAQNLPALTPTSEIMQVTEYSILQMEGISEDCQFGSWCFAGLVQQ